MRRVGDRKNIDHEKSRPSNFCCVIIVFSIESVISFVLRFHFKFFLATDKNSGHSYCLYYGP